MKIKVYASDIILILFFHISFITLPYFQSYNLIKYGIIFLIAIFLLSNIRIILIKKNRKVNIVLLLFLITLLIASFINRSNVESRDVWLAAIIYSAIILEGFLLFQYYEYKKKLEKVFIIFFYLTLFYIVITDLLIFIKPVYVLNNHGVYFVGDKFCVAYLHLLLIILYWKTKINNSSKLFLSNKFILFIMFSITVLVSIFIDSISGIIGLIVLLFFFIFNKRISCFISKPIIVIVTLISSCSFLFLFDAVLNSTFMKFIIEDVLGRDITLTGRLRIYDNVFSILADHFWSGYGHGSSYEICMKLLGAPNTQNGLLEILLQYGFIGVITVICLIYMCFRKKKMSNDMFPIVAMLYVYILLASIEITIGLQFFLLLAIYNVTGNRVPSNTEIGLEEQNVRIN